MVVAVVVRLVQLRRATRRGGVSGRACSRAGAGARRNGGARSRRTLGRGVPPRPSSTAETSSSCRFASVIFFLGEHATATVAMALTDARTRADACARSSRYAANARVGTALLVGTAPRDASERACLLPETKGLLRSQQKETRQGESARKSLVVARSTQRFLPHRRAGSRRARVPIAPSRASRDSLARPARKIRRPPRRRLRPTGAPWRPLGRRVGRPRGARLRRGSCPVC